MSKTIQIFAGGESGHGSVSCSGGELPDLFCPAVSGDKDTGYLRQAIFTGSGVARRVKA